MEEINKKRTYSDAFQLDTLYDTQANHKCPFIATIKRHLLDFDFKKTCSISLSPTNVYGCLVCGKYFQGKGKGTHAYTHSLTEQHHMFINLCNQNIYCLPDDYEVFDQQMSDIKFNLKPQFTKHQIELLDIQQIRLKSLDGTEFNVGYVGLNNLKKTDYINVVLQIVCHIPSIRDFLLEYEDNTTDILYDKEAVLLKRMAEFTCKLWNFKNFKAHVSPHELIQAITIASNKRFVIEKQSDPYPFLVWLLNTLNAAIIKKTSNSLLQNCFQGEVRIHKLVPLETEIRRDPNNIKASVLRDPKCRKEVIDSKYWVLSLEIPANALIKTDQEKNCIPQIPLSTLMEKYNGSKVTDEVITGIRKLYELRVLPKYLVLYFKRIIKNQFFEEKLSTIVNFPLKGVKIADYKGNLHTYSLFGNIIHDGKPNEGTYRVQIKNQCINQWMEISDLNVQKIIPQQVVLAETYVAVFEKEDSK